MSARRERVEFYLESIQISRYALAGVIVVSVYDWLESFSDEVELIHSSNSRWGSVKIAYLLCRYYALGYWPLALYDMLGNHEYETCKRIAKPIHALELPLTVLPQAVMLLRAYGFTGRDKRVLSLLGLCFAALLGVNIWVFCVNVRLVSEDLYKAVGRPMGCYPDYGTPMSLHLGVSMALALVMDFLSLGVVIFHCWRTRNIGGPLGKIFVAQGFGAFAAVCAVTALSAALFFGFGFGLLLPYILSVSNAMACRIILGLRRRIYRTNTQLSRDHSKIVREALERNLDSWGDSPASELEPRLPQSRVRRSTIDLTLP